MLVVGIAATPPARSAGASAPAAQSLGPYPDPDFLHLDSWIVIRADNTATFFVGKTDLGRGTGTAFRQIMCDELDIAYEKTSCVMGSTHNTVDRGGSADPTRADRRLSHAPRRRRSETGAAGHGPHAPLAVSDGVVSMIQTPATPGVRHAETSVTYGDLIGDKRFTTTLTGKNTDITTGIAKLAGAGDEERRLPAAVPRPKYAMGLGGQGLITGNPSSSDPVNVSNRPVSLMLDRARVRRSGRASSAALSCWQSGRQRNR